MGPSEAEIAARLAELRRRREAIDREIADLLLYLELGRRLSGGAEPGPAPPESPPAGRGAGAPGPEAGPTAWPAPRPAASSAASSALSPAPGPAPWPSPAGAPAAAPGGAGGLPPAVAFADDPAAARRYGRALVEAACAVIARAGGPVHVSAILPHLLAQGFTVPGADPVAALNTRLWKRSGPGGPLMRLGDATYALMPGPGDPDAIGR